MTEKERHNVATTSIWSVKGWLGKVMIYVENPEKTMNPETAEIPESISREESDRQGLADVMLMQSARKRPEGRRKGTTAANLF